jgi:hypothetical protein
MREPRWATTARQATRALLASALAASTLACATVKPDIRPSEWRCYDVNGTEVGCESLGLHVQTMPGDREYAAFWNGSEWTAAWVWDRGRITQLVADDSGVFVPYSQAGQGRRSGSSPSAPADRGSRPVVRPGHQPGDPVYPTSACIGAVVNGVCHGRVLSIDPMPERCYGAMIGGKCTGPQF